MISFDEAFALTRDAARPLGQQRLPLEQAHGHVVAAPVRARIDFPRADVSTMDGYAVRRRDLVHGPARLSVVGAAYPGASLARVVGAGECARIFTGAPVPAGADQVIPQELVDRRGGCIELNAPSAGHDFIRGRASDFREGEVLLPIGRRLDARALTAAAAADQAEIEVFRRPRMRVLVTGDELAPPGAARNSAYAVPDSISVGLAALAHPWCEQAVSVSRLRDDIRGLTAAAESVLTAADVVVVTGGASVGEKDLAKKMFEPSGLELIFSRVAIKPGKPVWLGRAAGAIVLGLPGNPTSAFVTARLFLEPLLRGLGGEDPSSALIWDKARLAWDLDATGDRETFLRGRWASTEREAVETFGNQDSGAQKVLAEADVLVRRRQGAPAVAAGELVEVLIL